MKYSMSNIMKRAWELKKFYNTSLFGECLKIAWAEAKGAEKKDIIILRLHMAAGVASERCRYDYKVYVKDWERGGKSRTYMSVYETLNGTRHNIKIDCGYFDNVLNEYVSGYHDLTDRFDLCGRSY